MCPQKQAVCGSNQTVSFTESGAEANITMTGMSDGDSCTYKIKSSKGSPAFRVSNDSTITDSKVNITYVEFESSMVNKTTTYGTGADKSPKEDMPARNQSFENSGEQGNATKGG